MPEGSQSKTQVMFGDEQVHDDDATVSEGTARALIDTQFPDYACLSLRRLPAAGTVNVVFRLGVQLAVRFPRRAGDRDATRTALELEAERVAEFAGRSPFKAPTPVGVGGPAFGYPNAWSIQTWVPGSTASPTAAAGSAAFAYDLAALISSLRATPTRGRRFASHRRGGDLASHDDWVETCLAKSQQLLDTAELRGLWGRLRATPRHQPDRMTHGDLTPANVLLTDGRLAGVVDTGGFGPADPALDLVSAWHLLGARARGAFREALGCDDVEWDRGKAWAFEQAIGAAWYYQASNPAMHEMGMTTLERLLASET